MSTDSSVGHQPVDQHMEEAPTNISSSPDAKLVYNQEQQAQTPVPGYATVCDQVQESSLLPGNLDRGYREKPTDSRKEDAPKLRGHLFHDIPQHDFILPSGSPINATVAEIIAIFPNWFKNVDIALRFHNNGITSTIHFAIFEEYRDLGAATSMDCERARDYITDQYRKTMRKVIEKWTKASHQTPKDWDRYATQINNFLPDVARQPNFVAPAPILFTDLAKGLKKLPQGDDAGDLTRALEYALQNKARDDDGNPVTLLFPTHLQAILDFVGRTTITKARCDPEIIARYAKRVRDAAFVKREEKRKVEENLAAAQEKAGVWTPKKQPIRLQPTIAQPVQQVRAAAQQVRANSVPEELIDPRMLNFDAFLQQPPPAHDPFLDPELGQFYAQYRPAEQFHPARPYQPDYQHQQAEQGETLGQETFTMADLDTLIADCQTTYPSYTWDPADLSDSDQARMFESHPPP